MAETTTARGENSCGDFDWDPKTERLHQIRVGLAMSPAERLRWLETAIAELRPWVGRAREASRDPSEV